MQYKIGDVARILGISADLLRYYEKKGVVTPTKDKQNDYRYYDAWDINFLLDCLWYKSFGFGIPETACLVTDCGYSELLSMLHDKQTELKDSIHHQQMLLQRMEHHTEEIACVKDHLGKIDITDCPAFVRYLNRFDSSYENSVDTQTLSKQWLSYMPFIQRYFEMPMKQGEMRPSHYAWGFSFSMEYIHEFSVPIEPPAVTVPAATCIHSAFRSSGKNAFQSSHVHYLYDYAEEQGLTPCGNARGNLVCSVIEQGENTGYFEVWLPIAESC